LHTLRHMLVYMMQTKYKQLQAGTWRGSLSFSFGVTAWWISMCWLCVF
jgi:hypothetical protein